MVHATGENDSETERTVAGLTPACFNKGILQRTWSSPGGVNSVRFYHVLHFFFYISRQNELEECSNISYHAYAHVDGRAGWFSKANGPVYAGQYSCCWFEASSECVGLEGSYISREELLPSPQSSPKLIIKKPKRRKVTDCWLFLMSIPFYLNRDPEITGWNDFSWEKFYLGSPTLVLLPLGNPTQSSRNPEHAVL